MSDFYDILARKRTPNRTPDRREKKMREKKRVVQIQIVVQNILYHYLVVLNIKTRNWFLGTLPALGTVRRSWKYELKRLKTSRCSAPANCPPQYRPVASLLPTAHPNTSQSLRSCQLTTQIQASRSAPANWPLKYKPVAPLLPTPHPNSLLYWFLLNLAWKHQFSTLNSLFRPFGERVGVYMIERICQESSGGHFELPKSYVSPWKLCSAQPQHLCKSTTPGPFPSSPRDPPAPQITRWAQLSSLQRGSKRQNNGLWDTKSRGAEVFWEEVNRIPTKEERRACGKPERRERVHVSHLSTHPMHSYRFHPSIPLLFCMMHAYLNTNSLSQLQLGAYRSFICYFINKDSLVLKQCYKFWSSLVEA